MTAGDADEMKMVRRDNQSVEGPACSKLVGLSKLSKMTEIISTGSP